MSSQTMAQARRTRLKRALTEVTSDTVSYVRTVGKQSQIKHNTYRTISGHLTTIHFNGIVEKKIKEKK